MKSKLFICILALLFICTLAMFYRAKTSAEDTIKQSQRLFDVDQKMISLDVNAYQALFHCYDEPKTCNIYDPNGEADKLASESMRLTKEKQAIIAQYPYLIPEQYKKAWGVK